MRFLVRLLPAALLIAAVTAGPATANATNAQPHSSIPACTVSGGGGNDVLVAHNATDVLCGFQGKDTLVDLQAGGTGDGSGNFLRGGRGNDVLRADDGDGSDTLIGGPGNGDTCIGDAFDTFDPSCENIVIVS